MSDMQTPEELRSALRGAQSLITSQDEEIERLQQQLSEANKVLEGKWISVEDRLAELLTEVLVLVGDYDYQYHKIDQQIAKGVWKNWKPNYVTHWMPLPTAPTKEDG